MIPAFLLPERTVREGGHGPEIALGAGIRRPLLLTLGINRILEQENLEVFICGASESGNWRPIMSFPPKSYCGTYHQVVDLALHPDVTRLRAQWKMNRWDERRQPPLFGFYLYLEEPRVSVAGAA